MSADDCRKGDEMDQPSEVLPLIGQIAKLQLRRGDALVLRTKMKLSDRQWVALRNAMDVFLGTIGLSRSIVPVLLLEEGMLIQVLDARNIVRFGDPETGEVAKQA